MILSLESIVVATKVLVVLDLQQPCDFWFNACSGMVKTVTLSSAHLYSGPTESPPHSWKASIQLSFNNPGDPTYISSISIWQMNQTYYYANSTRISSESAAKSYASITSWMMDANSTNQMDFSKHSKTNELIPGTASTFVFYPATATPMNISLRDSWNFAINFSNGESVSGSLISQ